jgi:hypothetical protein
MIHKLYYKVIADFLPYRAWFVSAKSQSEARAKVSREYKIPYERISAKMILCENL